MNKNIKYNLALDIGVGSIGWCLLDEKCNILKKDNRLLFGSRIFNEGETAENRREKRAARRRIRRRKERIRILQSLLKDDIYKVDSAFYNKMEESKLIKEEKTKTNELTNRKYNLFEELNFNDKNLYKKYKTIYHLRKELVENSEKKDIRLVYLAIHHIIKYRGNFLYKSDFEEQSNSIASDLKKIFMYIINLDKVDIDVKYKQIIGILNNNEMNKQEKEDILSKTYIINLNKTKDKEKINKKIKEIFKAILGKKFNFKNIVNISSSKENISFKDELDAYESEIENNYSEEYNILLCLKKYIIHLCYQIY